MLDGASVRVQRLQNRLESLGLDAGEIALLYRDGVHLTRRGWVSGQTSPNLLRARRRVLLISLPLICCHASQTRAEAAEPIFGLDVGRGQPALAIRATFSERNL